MNHKHFEQISSTQDYLTTEKFSENEVLVSCDTQTNGHGQYDRKWQSFDETLCFSCLLTPNDIMTLTSLEVGCLLHSYFKQEYGVELALKWPNDLLTSTGEKVGGVIINNQNHQDSLVVGIGLNFFKTKTDVEKFQTPYGHIFEQEFKLNKKEESAKIYKFLNSRRMHSKAIVEYWNKNCFHLNKNVSFIDVETEHFGIFNGIGHHGQAIIKTADATHEFYSGSIILR